MLSSSEQVYRDLQNREAAMDPTIEKLQKEIKHYDLFLAQTRDSHLHKNRSMGDSVFTYREPTIIRDNRTLIGSQSVLPNSKKLAGKNQKTKTSRGFCSMFGFGGK